MSGQKEDGKRNPNRGWGFLFMILLLIYFIVYHRQIINIATHNNPEKSELKKKDYIIIGGIECERLTYVSASGDTFIVINYNKQTYLYEK